MNLYFNMTFSGVVSHDPDEAHIALSKTELKSNLEGFVSSSLANGLVTGDSSSRLDQYEVTAHVDEWKADLFPDYKKHTEKADFVKAFISACDLMQQNDATGGIIAILPRSGVTFLAPETLKELLSQENLYEAICKYEMVLFDGGNIHGDSWKNSFYPRKMIQTFVYET